MAKFNRLKKVFKKKNYEGAMAFKLDNKIELYNLVTTSLIDNKYYESENKQLNRIKKLIAKNDPMFSCKLAVYARENMYLRSVPAVIMVQLAKAKLKESFDRRYLGKTVTRVIKRVDEITELLSYYQLENNRNGTKKLNKLSKQLAVGIKESFNNFDEYQFAKYNRKGEVTLKDSLFLTHPKAKDDKQQNIFDKIVNDTLEIPYTWEVELSKNGNTKETWEKLIDSGRIGYMAILRNLRNILNAGVSNFYLNKVSDFISDKEKVLRSKQMPMRFYSAYREISGIAGSSIFIEALEKAVDHSVENIDFFKADERVLIASDVSGSMIYPMSKRSKLEYYDIGLMLSMLLRSKLGNNVTTGIFGDRWKVKNLPRKNVLANVDYLKSIVSVPISVLLGIIPGVILGLLLVTFFKKNKDKTRATEKTLLILGLSIILIEVGHWVHAATLLGIMTIGFILLEKSEEAAHELSKKLGKVWIFAEILLFVLIGMAVDVNIVIEEGMKGLIIITIGLVFRSLGVFLATLFSKLNLKERLFCVIAYLPKATVQAALGAAPLAAGIKNGEVILAIAVLSILFTAPLGLFGIRLFGPKLLSIDVKK